LFFMWLFLFVWLKAEELLDISWTIALFPCRVAGVAGFIGGLLNLFFFCRKAMTRARYQSSPNRPLFFFASFLITPIAAIFFVELLISKLEDYSRDLDGASWFSVFWPIFALEGLGFFGCIGFDIQSCCHLG